MPLVSRPMSLLNLPRGLWYRLGRRRDHGGAGVLREPVELYTAPPEEDLSRVESTNGTPNGSNGTNGTSDHHDEADVEAEADVEVVAVPPLLTETLEEIRGIRGDLASEGERAQRMRDRLAVLGDIPDQLTPLAEMGREVSLQLDRLHEQSERTTACVATLEPTLKEGQTRSQEIADRQNRLIDDQADAFESLQATFKDGHARSHQLAEQQNQLITDQTDVLDSLQTAIERTTEVAVDTRSTLASLDSASERLAATTERLANALQKASESARSREVRMTESLNRTHRWTVTAVYVCGAAATLALIGVGIVLAM